MEVGLLPVLGLQALREIWARTVHRTTSPVYVGCGLQGLQNLGQLQPRAPEISKPPVAVSSVPPSLGSKEVYEPLPALGTGPAAENPTISHAKLRAKSRMSSRTQNAAAHPRAPTFPSPLTCSRFRQSPASSTCRRQKRAVAWESPPTPRRVCGNRAGQLSLGLPLAGKAASHSLPPPLLGASGCRL